MKAYDITKLTAELKSSDNIQHLYFVGSFGRRGYCKHVGLHNVKVIVGRRQVTVRFMN